MVKLTGTPIVLDQMLRPLVRVVQVAVAGVATLVLAWFGLWWWVPVPIVVTTVAYELFFWSRGDRPVVLALESDRLVLTDPRAGGDGARPRELALPLHDVHTATLHVRPAPSGDRVEAVVVLTDTERVRFAVRFLVEPGLPLRHEDVQADVMDNLVGGYGGLLRALAPADVTCRQTIDDPAGQAIRWLRERLPAGAWQRSAARVWRGTAPVLDTFGLHVGPPDGLLVLDGDAWSLHTADGELSQGLVTLVRSGRATRQVGLVRKPDLLGDAPLHELPIDEVDLPLLVLDLDEGLTLAVPATVAGKRGDVRVPEGTWWHTHVPEGAALTWHLLTRWPESTWPTALRTAAATVIARTASPPSGASPRTARPRSPSRGG